MPVIASLTLAFVFSKSPNLKREADAHNAAICSAMKSKNLDKLEKILRACTTPDFKYVDQGQEEGFDGMWQSMKMGIGSMSMMETVTNSNSNVKVHGSMGTCITHHHMVGRQMGQDHKTHKLDFSGNSLDTFQLMNGHWMLSRMEWKNQTIKMDGKKIDPSKMGG